MFKCKQLNNSYIHLRIDYILFNQELNKLFGIYVLSHINQLK